MVRSSVRTLTANNNISRRAILVSRAKPNPICKNANHMQTAAILLSCRCAAYLSVEGSVAGQPDNRSICRTLGIRMDVLSTSYYLSTECTPPAILDAGADIPRRKSHRMAKNSQKQQIDCILPFVLHSILYVHWIWVLCKSCSSSHCIRPISVWRRRGGGSQEMPSSYPKVPGETDR